MKAAVYDSKLGVKLSCSRKVPKRPAATHCLIKVMAAGVNPVDAKFVVGDKIPEFLKGFFKWALSGSVPGFDWSGVVVESPPDSPFKPGDEAYGLNYQFKPGGMKFNGTFAEIISVPVAQMWRKPTSLSFAEAAALPLVGTTCLQALEQHGIRAADEEAETSEERRPQRKKVLVLGASGGVGHMLTKILTLKNCDVTGVCSSKNIEFVKECGAKNTVDYRSKEGIEGGLRVLVQEQGCKFDVCFDTVSSADSRDKIMAYEKKIKALDVLKMKGAADPHNYVVFGGSSFNFLSAAVKRFLKINIFRRNFELFWIDMTNCRRCLKELQERCDESGLKPTVTKVLPFNEDGLREAFHDLDPPKNERRSAIGKIVIETAQPITGG